MEEVIFALGKGTIQSTSALPRRLVHVDDDIVHFFTIQQKFNYFELIAFSLHRSLQRILRSILNNILGLLPAKRRNVSSY